LKLFCPLGNQQPAWQTARYYFRLWRKNEVWQRIQRKFGISWKTEKNLQKLEV
jgi:hypothetical protein